MLHDGTRLFVRMAVRKILRTPELGDTGYPDVTMESTNIVTAYVPDWLKRQPSIPPYDPRVDKGEEIRFEAQEEKW